MNAELVSVTPFSSASGNELHLRLQCPVCRQDLRGSPEGSQSTRLASDSIPSREFLTRQVLSELAEKFCLRWRVETPWYGVNWALRPLKARLRRKREPARFHVVWARAEK